MSKSFLHAFEDEVARYEGKVLEAKEGISYAVFEEESNAVACALEVQRILQGDPGTPLRIGIQQGELIDTGDEVFGEGISEARNISSMAIGGSILLSDVVYQKIASLQQFATTPLGSWKPGKIETPIKLFALANDGLVVPKRENLKKNLKKKEKISPGAWVAIIIMLILMIVVGSYIVRVFINSME